MDSLNSQLGTRCIPLLLTIAIVQYEAVAQNLVLNPSFEAHSCCPSSFGPNSCATHWTTNMNSWDYFHACNGTVVSVPNNFAGHQWAASGVAYAGFIAWGRPPSDPLPHFPIELIGGSLSQPLEIGTTYHVSFKVSLASSELRCCFADKLGILFTNASYGSLNYSQSGRPPIVQDFAHVHSNSVVLDSVNWTTIEGSFIADSAYTHFLIGRFFTEEPDADPCWCTEISVNDHAYYYLDDVCVSSASHDCRVAVGSDEIRASELPITWTITPSSIHITTGNGGPNVKVDLFDALGRHISSTVTGTFVTLDVAPLNAGVYILRISGPFGAYSSLRILVP